MSIEHFEEQIRIGRIEFDLLERMAEAEQYGAASSMSWLTSIISKLEILIDAGVVVRINTKNKVVYIDSLGGLKNFCRENFPDAARALYG